MSFITSYSTRKYVRIYDERLAGLHLFLILAIVGYVVIVEMIKLGGYLQSNPVDGVVEFSLREPTVDNCDPSAVGCLNNFQPLNELEYCAQHHQQQQQADAEDGGLKEKNGNYTGKVYPCQLFGADLAKMIRETSIIIWTRAAIYNQTLTCGDGLSNELSESAMTCPKMYQNDQVDHPPFFIAQTEAYTLLLNHAVTASGMCDDDYHNNYACSAQATHYQGRLYSTNDELCQEEFAKQNSFTDLRGPDLQSFAPCYIGPNVTDVGQDFFSLDVLLRAVGVTLDDCVNDNATTDKGKHCKTYRDSGATLLINIVWNDFRPFRGLVEPYYYYTPRLIGTHYKESLPFYHPYRSSRTLLRAHGIKIAVLVSGNFHRFQSVSFLITFTTAIGLLAVARKVVDFFMLHGLPEKVQYEQVKFEALSSKEEEDNDVSMPNYGSLLN